MDTITQINASIVAVATLLFAVSKLLEVSNRWRKTTHAINAQTENPNSSRRSARSTRWWISTINRVLGLLVGILGMGWLVWLAVHPSPAPLTAGAAAQLLVLAGSWVVSMCANWPE